MKQRITIIGGSGFLGTNLCHQLILNDYNFEIIDLKMSKRFPNKCKIADVRDLQSLRETITGDVIVNLAAVHRDDIKNLSEYHRTNVDGAKNIALICNEKNIKKIIFTSTVAVYGFAVPGTDESGEINPFNEYGKTKYAAEQALCEWQSKGNHSLIIIRPTVIFGEGNRGNVFNLMNQIASGKFLMIGNGKNKKSMAYVKNVAAFIEKCILQDLKFKVFNYVDTPDMTMNELVSQIRLRIKGKAFVGIKIPYILGLLIGGFVDIFSKILKKNFPISLIRVKKFAATSQFRSAKNELDGFIAPFTLLEGLERTLQSEFIRASSDKEVFKTLF